MSNRPWALQKVMNNAFELILIYDQCDVKQIEYSVVKSIMLQHIVYIHD